MICIDAIYFLGLKIGYILIYPMKPSEFPFQSKVMLKITLSIICYQLTANNFILTGQRKSFQNRENDYLGHRRRHSRKTSETPPKAAVSWVIHNWLSVNIYIYINMSTIMPRTSPITLHETLCQFFMYHVK